MVCLLPVTEHARLVTNNLCKDGYAFLIPGNDSFSSQTSIPDPITTYLPKALIDSILLEPISAGSYRSYDDLEKETLPCEILFMRQASMMLPAI
jgi:hypothetical protein